MSMDLIPAPDPLISTDLRMADGVFAKTMVIPKVGMIVGQHSHTFAHVSVLVRGSVRVWKGVEPARDFSAPIGILIDARTKHRFMALEDDTIVLCVHDIGTAEGIEIEEENDLFEGEA